MNAITLNHKIAIKAFLENLAIDKIVSVRYYKKFDYFSIKGLIVKKYGNYLPFPKAVKIKIRVKDGDFIFVK